MTSIETVLSGVQLAETALPREPSADGINCCIPRELLLELLVSGALCASQLRCLDTASVQTLRRCVLDSCRAQPAVAEP